MHNCLNLESLSLSLSLSLGQQWVGSGGSSEGLLRLRGKGCPGLISIRLSRCSESLVPSLHQAVEFCVERVHLESVAIVRVGNAAAAAAAREEAEGRPNGEQQPREAAATKGGSSSSPTSIRPCGGGSDSSTPSEGNEKEDLLERLLSACTELETLELSAAAPWPKASLATLIRFGRLGAENLPQIRRLIVHEFGAHAAASEQQRTATAAKRGNGSGSPTELYEAVRARVNATAAPTKVLFFTP